MDKEVSLERAVDGRTWTVAFRVPEEFSVWTQGWPDIAFHYNLQPGHILVFVLVAHSRFRFTLFNDHGCQIIHPAFSPPSSSPKFYIRRLQSGKSEGVTAALKSRAAPRKSKAQPDDGPHQEERTLSATTTQSAGILLNDAPVQIAYVNPISFLFFSKRRDVTPVERREARRAASRYSQTLSNPNSMTVLRPSHVYKDFDCVDVPRRLLLPLSWGAAAVSSHSYSVLTLIDSTGRSWEMQWNARGRHRLTPLPKDWAQFAVNHFLEGDVCVFETTDGEALTVLVRIFRVVGIPSGLRIDDVSTHYSVVLAS